ncbi:SRPBCC family protein [Martelella soudanensis]|uniref:SRPBCC family protein n=1 Tax=unclassified Martelella TaxID=2629616 RepID=UPI0015E03D31|nr:MULTISPECIES: SRPBCC domain-containing protein [unclassified Martelella]
MTEIPPETRSVVVERDFAVSPARVWRALTQPHLIQEWLMKNDFRPDPGAAFTMTGDWRSVNCEVLTIEEERELSYTWQAYGLETVVIWTLTPTSAGTRLRMEQSGFKPDQDQAYGGAKGGWAMFFDNLENVLEQQ